MARTINGIGLAIRLPHRHAVLDVGFRGCILDSAGFRDNAKKMSAIPRKQSIRARERRGNGRSFLKGYAEVTKHVVRHTCLSPTRPPARRRAPFLTALIVRPPFAASFGPAVMPLEASGIGVSIIGEVVALAILALGDKIIFVVRVLANDGARQAAKVFMARGGVSATANI